MSENEHVFQRCAHDKKNPYVMISREMAQDPTISPKAKGVLLYLLSLPSDWKIYHSHIRKSLGVGENYLNSALEELIKVGYADRTRIKINGVFQPYQYIIREFKKCLPNGISQTGFPGPGNPVIQKKEAKLLSEETSYTKKTATIKKENVAVFSKIYPELSKYEELGLLYSDQVEISSKYSTDQIDHAIKWITHPLTKIKKCFAAALKWACETQPEIPIDVDELRLINKVFAQKYDMVSIGDYTIYALNNFVEFVNMSHPMARPLVVIYADKDFMKNFNNIILKIKNRD